MSANTTTPLLEERWLKCEVDKGMFSNELAVTYPTDDKLPANRKQTSVFVESKFVKVDNGRQGRVRVRVVRGDENILAIIPSPEQDIVTVSEADLES